MSRVCKNAGSGLNLVNLTGILTGIDWHCVFLRLTTGTPQATPAVCSVAQNLAVNRLHCQERKVVTKEVKSHLTPLQFLSEAIYGEKIGRRQKEKRSPTLNRQKTRRTTFWAGSEAIWTLLTTPAHLDMVASGWGTLDRIGQISLLSSMIF